MAEGHQSVLDHPNKLNSHDQDEGNHEERPDGLHHQVVHLDIHHVPLFPDTCSPADAQHLVVSSNVMLCAEKGNAGPSLQVATESSTDPGAFVA